MPARDDRRRSASPRRGRAFLALLCLLAPALAARAEEEGVYYSNKTYAGSVAYRIRYDDPFGFLRFPWETTLFGSISSAGYAAPDPCCNTSSNPAVFVPENMVEAKPGLFYPIYPIGYPLLCAVAYWLGGAEGPFRVNPVLLLVALVGVFFLAVASRLSSHDLG